MAIDPLVLIFLSSGLFLGWALGANDAANVFGTAVPKTLAASFAPKAQPRKRPLDRKINTRGSIAIKIVF